MKTLYTTFALAILFLASFMLAPMSFAKDTVAVIGTIKGKPFQPNTVSLERKKSRLFDGYMLRFVKGEDWISGDMSICISIKRKNLEGKTIKVSSTKIQKREDPIGMVNFIVRNPKGGSKTSAIGQKYDLKLEFGKKKGNMLPGKVSLNAPTKDSKIQGTFSVAVKP